MIRQTKIPKSWIIDNEGDSESDEESLIAADARKSASNLKWTRVKSISQMET